MKMKLVKMAMRLVTLTSFSQVILATSLFEQPDWEPSWLAMQVPMWFVGLAWIYVWITSDDC